jgi:hypothetical protein
MKENCKKIWKKWKKSRLNSEMMWKIENKIGKNRENMEENSKMIWKI